uniref:BTB domain-containing protein n=1 Tax=Panagrolaimus sp. ES5 TaxID=591445 RepID=A0AC34G1D4_9BILA
MTDEIEGTWMMKYTPYGTNLNSPAASLMSNSIFRGMLDERRSRLRGNALISFTVKGNKKIDAKWQWTMKTQTAYGTRSAEINRQFEASGSYAKGDKTNSLNYPATFENGNEVVQINGILTWDSDLCKIPRYGFSTCHDQICGEIKATSDLSSIITSNLDLSNVSVVLALQQENMKLKQRNYFLENEIKKLNLNQTSVYGNQKSEGVITLKAENREFQVSKTALFCNSEILQDQNTDTITLSCDASTLEKFVNYCNNDKLTFDPHSLNSDQICKLLSFLNQYKVNGLKVLVEQNLIQNLDHANIHEFAAFAETYEMENLFHECLRFAKNSLKSSNPISKEKLSKQFKTRLMEMMF